MVVFDDLLPLGLVFEAEFPKSFLLKNLFGNLQNSVFFATGQSGVTRRVVWHWLDTGKNANVASELEDVIVLLGP